MRKSGNCRIHSIHLPTNERGQRSARVSMETIFDNCPFPAMRTLGVDPETIFCPFLSNCFSLGLIIETHIFSVFVSVSSLRLRHFQSLSQFRWSKSSLTDPCSKLCATVILVIIHIGFILAPSILLETVGTILKFKGVDWSE